MSMDSCPAGFTLSERRKFLDQKLIDVMDRLEREDSLRTAGLENLVGCPFCPFAAECLSVTVDKEFRCLNPDCEIISCRLCQSETHIPKSCDEHAKHSGSTQRHRLEEEMTRALIRNCNKCNGFPPLER